MYTKSMQRAEEWLDRRGGSGVLDERGNVIAGGKFDKFAAITWLRLVAAGRVAGKGGRLFVVKGRAEIAEAGDG